MDADTVRRRLADEEARLRQIVEDTDGTAHETEADSLGELSGYDQHQADVGTETFNRERDLSILDEVEAELADIEHALRRLDDGTYGTCEACGRPIGDERLEAMPAARFCVEDQAAAEGEIRAANESPEG